jgi:hypothetical protein
MNTISQEAVTSFRIKWEEEYPSYQPRWLAYCASTDQNPHNMEMYDYREWISWLVYKFSPDGKIHDHTAFTDFIWRHVVENMGPSQILFHFGTQEVELK